MVHDPGFSLFAAFFFAPACAFAQSGRPTVGPTEVEIQMVAVGFSREEIEFVAHSKFPSGVAPDLSISDWKILDSRASNRGYQPMPTLGATAGYVLEFEAER